MQGSGNSPEDSIDVDLSPEQAFRLTAEQVFSSMNVTERQEAALTLPLPSSHPRYHPLLVTSAIV
jgi:hypothetical protein